MNRRKRQATAELADQEPPNNPEMEQEVLGCIMVWAQVFGGSSHGYVRDAIQTLEPADFYDHMRRKIFEAIVAGKHAVGTVGLTLERLKRAGLYSPKELTAKDLTKQVDAAYLHTVMGKAALPPYLPFYCCSLRRLRLEREARRLSWEIVVSSHNQDVVQWAQHACDRIEKLKAMAEVNDAKIKEIESKAEEIRIESRAKIKQQEQGDAAVKPNGRNGGPNDGKATADNRTA